MSARAASRHIVAYYRVSTKRQGVSGLGLDAQRAAVRDYARRAGKVVLAEFTEVESGRKCGRPHLRAALARAREAGCELVVAKLDRLSRDARFVLELVDGDVALCFLDLPGTNGRTAAGRMFLGMMAQLAEYESRRIGERVRAANAARKARPGAKSKAPGRRLSAAHQRRAVAALHARNRVRAASTGSDTCP